MVSKDKFIFMSKKIKIPCMRFCKRINENLRIMKKVSMNLKMVCNKLNLSFNAISVELSEVRSFAVVAW